MKTQVSIVNFEKNREGKFITNGYTLTGNPLTGYLVHYVVAGKDCGGRGTPSSNYKKPFKTMPKNFTV